MSEPIITPENKIQARQRLQALMDELKQRDLDGFLVPLADEHQGEYVPPRAQRLAWLTGFTGSAGLAIVYCKTEDTSKLDNSAIFVDGRYTLQVREQVDTDTFSPKHIIEQSPADWLSETLSQGDKIGFDAWLHTPEGSAKLEKACKKAGAELLACDSNPVDAVWDDQPDIPLAPVVPHLLEYAGEEADSKRQRIAQQLVEDNIDAAVLSLPDSIAWLLNIRGADVTHNPIALGFALVHKDSHVQLFMDERKISPEIREYLGNQVSIESPVQFAQSLQALSDKTVRLDRHSAPSWVLQQLEQAGAIINAGMDPCVLPKARKNDTEMAGTRAAHERDGVALCRFLYWLDQNSGTGDLDEISVAEHLHALRAESGQLKDLSFDTISGAGPNGAIVHYRVTAESNKKLSLGSLYLVDSGAQYLDGTTDVTRTIAIGTPSAEQRDRFTRVLKGHIAIALARFPKGTSGAQLDPLARYALWQAGLDYDHGTGHGVGSYLSVHEGPQRIAKAGSDIALAPGMIVSNEPGYYKSNEYGIRIENIVLVTEAQDIAGGERPMLGLETLTLAPIDQHLIEISLLNQNEIDWLNRYHDDVKTRIGPYCDADTRVWLGQACKPIEDLHEAANT